MSSKFGDLNDTFNVADDVVETEIVKKSPDKIAKPTSDDVRKDYDYTRGNLYRPFQGYFYGSTECLNYFESRRLNSQENNIISTNWELSNFTVSIDDKSAHVHYLNQGRFLMLDSLEQEQIINIEWLESAYFVKQNGSLKLKFLQSDDITKDNSTTPE